MMFTRECIRNFVSWSLVFYKVPTVGGGLEGFSSPRPAPIRSPVNCPIKCSLEELVTVRDVRVQILIWFQPFLLFTEPNFQTLKGTSFFRHFKLFQTFSDRRSHTPAQLRYRIRGKTVGPTQHTHTHKKILSERIDTTMQ